VAVMAPFNGAKIVQIIHHDLRGKLSPQPTYQQAFRKEGLILMLFSLALIVHVQYIDGPCKNVIFY